MGKMGAARVLLPVVAAVAVVLVGPAQAAAGGLMVRGGFSDNLVLQASSTKGAVLWGSATPGATVDVAVGSSVHGGNYTAAAGADGAWSVTLKPYEVAAGDGNSFTVEVASGSSTVVAKNVAYGDVFLCSGQSNMRLSLIPVYNATEIIAAADHPEIRLMYVPDAFATTEQDEMPNGTEWQVTSPQTVPQFSATCYLSTLAMQRLRPANPNVPERVYGLIDASVGSTDVQSWMSAAARKTALRSCWQPAGATTLPPSASKSPENGTAAEELWNAMIHPLLPMQIRAILWDQGENNAHYCNATQYNCLFASMINSWREAFGEDTPVAFAQIGGYAFLHGADNMSNWDIRYAQANTVMPGAVKYSTDSGYLHVPLSVMASTYDLGSPQYGMPSNHWWIHCRNKTEVGRRIALQLLELLGEPSGQEVVGPIVQQTVLDHTADQVPVAKIYFSHIGSKLKLQPAQGCIQCCNQTARRSPADATVFQVANRLGEWLDAIATLDPGSDDSIIVTPNTKVTGNWLSGVRFGFLDIPQCAPYNTQGLPAGQFSFPVPYAAQTLHRTRWDGHHSAPNGITGTS